MGGSASPYGRLGVCVELSSSADGGARAGARGADDATAGAPRARAGSAGGDAAADAQVSRLRHELALAKVALTDPR